MVKPHVLLQQNVNRYNSLTCRTIITIWESAFLLLFLLEVLSRLIDFFFYRQQTTPAFMGKNGDLKSKYLEMKSSKHCWNISQLPNSTEFH